MFKMNTIVLALDGSEGARRAIPFAVGLARESKSRIVIVHIDDRMGTRGHSGPLRNVVGDSDLKLHLPKRVPELRQGDQLH